MKSELQKARVILLIQALGLVALASCFGLWFLAETPHGSPEAGSSDLIPKSSDFVSRDPTKRLAARDLPTAAVRSGGLPPFAPAAAQPDKAVHTRMVQAYGKLPMHFEANQGQADGQVKFLARGRGYNILLTSTEAVMILGPEAKRSVVIPQPSARETTREKDDSQLPTVVRMKLVGAGAELKSIGIDELPGKSNYFIGNDPTKWRTNVPHYAKVRYTGVYPGVDLVYYGSQRQLEYDFVLAPGADPNVIQLAFDGTDKIEIDEAGHLVLHTATGQVQFRTPLIYQEVDSIRREIAGSYVFTPKSEISDHAVGFQVAAYDTSRPLVIDPVLVYSTYLGGSSNGGDFGEAIAVDSSGNAYVTGATWSANFPTTPGAFDVTCGTDGTCDASGSFPTGMADVFVTKLNPNGSALIYSTYLGGSDADGGKSIAVDAFGDAYVTGVTNSNDFPVTPGTFDTTCNNVSCSSGVGDGFVTKVNASGSALVYSTYIGGSSVDFGTAIAVDGSGNAYVTGRTNSDDFPTTPGAFQRTFLGNQYDVFVTKVNSTGSSLVYSTYLGGSQNPCGLFGDLGDGIAVDSAGNAYVTGQTSSPDFPVTPNAFQTSMNGCDDAFVTKLNAEGSALWYSTYLGGSIDEVGFGIAVDSAGNAYVTGLTFSTDFPTTPGAFQLNHGGGTGDAFVTKVDPSGSVLVYSTYLGGSFYDEGSDIAVDDTGNAYVTGYTSSTDFPTTPDGVQLANGGFQDAFVTKLNANGSAPEYSTYLGGGSSDGYFGTAIAVDAAGNAYMTGATLSNDFPTTPGAFQITRSGSDDAFVAKINDANPGPPIIGASSLPAGEVGVAYSAPLVTGGLPPYTFTLKKGISPPGLSTDPADGSLDGTPTSPALLGRTFTLQITDQLGASVKGTFRIKIRRALKIVTNSVKVGTHGESYKKRLLASGGKLPYTWSEISGNLPAELTLDPSTGVIKGTPAPSSIGTHNLTFKVTDPLTGEDQKDFTLTIN